MIQNVVSLLTIFITLNFSTIAIAIGTSISLLSYIPLYMCSTKRYLGISYSMQIGPMFKYTILAVIMAVCVTPINTVSLNGFLKLGLQVVLGAVTYIGLLVLTKDRFFFGILNKVKERIKTK